MPRKILTQPQDYHGIIRRNKGSRIPFGYREHPKDKHWLIPFPDELEAIKQAVEYYDNRYPVRSVREWFIKATGRYISIAGMFYLLRRNVRERTPAEA